MSHADRKLVAVALARAAEAGRDRQLAVGGVTARGSGPGSDPLLSLIETLAYAADVLQVELDEIADEAFIETSYDRNKDVVCIHFRADLRPVVCVLLDPDNVYLAAVGEQTGDSYVRFGDGAHGQRPPDGFENIAAEYRHGQGGGTLELGGLVLGEPIWLIALSRRHRALVSRVRCSETG